MAETVRTILSLPYVAYWLPCLLALAVGGGICLLFFRPVRPVAATPPAEPSPEADLVTTPHPSEQRRSFRRGGNSIGIFYKRPGQTTEPLRGSVVDRSMGGICLMMPESIPIGTILSIRTTNADDIVPWVDIEVCVCRPGEDSFEVGCRFVKTPPYSILLLFG
jgi:hypothetical protein